MSENREQVQKPRADRRIIYVIAAAISLVLLAVIILVVWLKPWQPKEPDLLVELRSLPSYPGATSVTLGFKDSQNAYGQTPALIKFQTQDMPKTSLAFYEYALPKAGWTYRDGLSGFNRKSFAKNEQYTKGLEFTGINGPNFGAPWFRLDTVTTAFDLSVFAYRVFIDNKETTEVSVELLER